VLCLTEKKIFFNETLAESSFWEMINLQVEEKLQNSMHLGLMWKILPYKNKTKGWTFLCYIPKNALLDICQLPSCRSCPLILVGEVWCCESIVGINDKNSRKPMDLESIKNNNCNSYWTQQQIWYCSKYVTWSLVFYFPQDHKWETDIFKEYMYVY
jgi:hypothetical protein